MIKFQEVNQTFFGFHGISDHCIDGAKVKTIFFSIKEPTRLSFTVRRDSDYLPVSRLGDARAVTAVYNEKLLQSILDTGDWFCLEDGHGSTTLVRKPPEAKKKLVTPIWTALLEQWHMNTGRQNQATGWTDVAKKINQRPESVNSLWTFFNRRIGL